MSLTSRAVLDSCSSRFDIRALRVCKKKAGILESVL